MPDPTLALNEQFCLARGFATSQAKQTADSVNASQEQITTICTKLKTILAPELSDYGTKTPVQVIGLVSDGLTAKNWTASKVQTTGRICLGEGYRADDTEIATAAAAALDVSGLKAYAEVIGHNLREGLGTTANPQAFKAWLTYAIAALKAGDAPAFLPGQTTERTVVLSAALAGL